MLQCQLKLRMGKQQEQTCQAWLFHLASLYHFAMLKIELNAKDKIYFSKQEFQNLLAQHSEKLGIPSHRLQGVLLVAFEAGKGCFQKLAGKPRLKGRGNKMASIPLPDPIQAARGNGIPLPALGRLRFHQMELPPGKIKCGRMVQRASG